MRSISRGKGGKASLRRALRACAWGAGLLALLGCALLQFGESAPEGAVPAEGGEAAPGEVLYQDDFSDPDSGWRRFRDYHISDYEDGQYRIAIDQDENSYVFPTATAGQRFGDVRVEFDATKLSGSDSAGVYVICRHQDDDNFYYAEIDSAGEATIAAFKDDEQEILVDDLPTSAIRPDANHLRFDCVGSSLVLYVNGEQVASASDSDIQEGDVGLGAGGSGQGQTDVRFDNFVVYAP